MRLECGPGLSQLRSSGVAFRVQVGLRPGTEFPLKPRPLVAARSQFSGLFIYERSFPGIQGGALLPYLFLLVRILACWPVIVFSWLSGELSITLLHLASILGRLRR